MSYLYGKKKKTDKIGRPQSDLQRLSSKENFALFLLKGIHSSISSPTCNLVPFAIRKTIQQAAQRGIEDIKARQYYRKLARDKEAKS